MSRSPGRKWIGASTCVYAWQATVSTVDWKTSPAACDFVSFGSTFQRKCGRIGNERSTMRIASSLYTDVGEKTGDHALHLGTVRAIGEVTAARHHVQPRAGNRLGHAA